MSATVEQTLEPHAGERAPSASAGWWALAGLALLGVILVLSTWANLEVTILSLLVAAAMLALVVSKPEIGIYLLMTNYLIASYPTPIRGQGLLTINNILGIILAVLLVARLAQHPDFWFLRARQVRLYVALGVVFIVSTIAASYQFPELRVTWGKVRTLDQTVPLARDFITRLAFVVLAINFLVDKTHLKRAMVVIMLTLVMVVPSALWGYVSGAAEGGYRAAATFSVGTNPNRLAFLCVMQIALWWYLMWALPAAWRPLCFGVIGCLIFTVFLTASRSGVLGLGVVMYLLTRGRGTVRGSRWKAIALVLIAAGVLLTAIPEENLQRIQNLNPFATKRSGEVGSYSTERRVATVGAGWQIFLDYPIFGIGLGNFREVALQVYRDPFYRSPHNSFLWAAAEGGIVCFMLFAALFWVTWRDIRWLQASPAVPYDLRWLASALEPSLILLLFYSAFSDIWLSPIAYILVTVVIVFRRYVSCRRVVLV